MASLFTLHKEHSSIEEEEEEGNTVLPTNGTEEQPDINSNRVLFQKIGKVQTTGVFEVSSVKLTDERYEEQVQQQKRQLTLLRESYETVQAENQLLKTKMKGYKVVSRSDCPNALEILTHLAGCNDFQNGCGPEAPIVHLLNSATVRVAHAGETFEHFCLSITFNSSGVRRFENEDDDEESDDSEEAVWGRGNYKKRKREKEKQVHYLRIRYECGNQVTLVERGAPDMRYIQMGQPYKEIKQVIKNYANHFAIPKKALLIILAMGVNLLPWECKKTFLRRFNAAESVLRHANIVSGEYKEVK